MLVFKKLKIKLGKMYHTSSSTFLIHPAAATLVSGAAVLWSYFFKIYIYFAEGRTIFVPRSSSLTFVSFWKLELLFFFTGDGAKIGQGREQLLLSSSVVFFKKILTRAEDLQAAKELELRRPK